MRVRSADSHNAGCTGSAALPRLRIPQHDSQHPIARIYSTTSSTEAGAAGKPTDTWNVVIYIHVHKTYLHPCLGSVVQPEAHLLTIDDVPRRSLREHGRRCDLPVHAGRDSVCGKLCCRCTLRCCSTAPPVASSTRCTRAGISRAYCCISFNCSGPGCKTSGNCRARTAAAGARSSTPSAPGREKRDCSRRPVLHHNGYSLLHQLQLWHFRTGVLFRSHSRPEHASELHLPKHPFVRQLRLFLAIQMLCSDVLNRQRLPFTVLFLGRVWQQCQILLQLRRLWHDNHPKMPSRPRLYLPLLSFSVRRMRRIDCLQPNHL